MMESLADTVQISLFLLLGWTLMPVVHTYADCTSMAMNAMGELSVFTRSTVARDNIYRLVPLLGDSDSMHPFCAATVDVSKKLNAMKEETCAVLWLDIFLAKHEGFEYMCSEGRQDYGRYSKCIYESTQTLEDECKMTYDSLTEIHGESYHTDSSTMCSTMGEYLQCSETLIATKCGGTEAGQWYKKFVAAVFSGLAAKTPKLSCSFGQGSLLPIWAICVIIVVALLILACIARCLFVDGHCARVFGQRCAPRRRLEGCEPVNMEAI